METAVWLYDVRTARDRFDGNLSNDTPDFIVKGDDGDMRVIEPTGREELDLPRTMARLAQWCEAATAASRAKRAGVPLCLRRSGRLRPAPSHPRA